MPAEPGTPGKSRARRLAGLAGTALVLLLAALALGVRHRLLASLPRLDGAHTVAGLASPVRIARDALGVPTIEAASRVDASFALGYLHAQERFFQMDLMRRSAAGELAALFGRSLLASDRAVRMHRLRDVARRVVSRLEGGERAHAEAYARGVAAGLADLGSRPCEYTLLGLRPAPWLVEDTILVTLAMFLELGDPTGSHDAAVGLVHDTLPESLAAFLDPLGTRWDAPLDGSQVPEAPIPSPAVVDLRRPAGRSGNAARGTAAPAVPRDLVPGSNNWAVAGTHTADRRALLAGDMHLMLGIPNTWYRASIVTPDPAAAASRRTVTGVTLPGTPALIAGSNGDVAWAFTNSEADVADLVVLEMVPQAGPGAYRVPGGLAHLETHTEKIVVRGGADDSLVVQQSRWGPVLGRDFAGRPRALRWTAHDPEALDLRLLGMELVRTVDEALALGPTCGIPPQNCVVADGSGRIGWTILGRLPRRAGFDGRRPVSWADGSCRWDGLLDAGEVPHVADPPAGRLWTANNRVVGGAALAVLGDGGWTLGARARQIRDAIFALEAARPADMLRIQLDDRALFLQPWRDLVLEVLTPAAVAADPRRQAARHLVEAWGGRAAVESAGYRIVRRCRDTLLDDVFMALASPCEQADERFQPRDLTQREGPVWRLLVARPPHLLDARYASWEAQILAAVDTTIERLAPVRPQAVPGNPAPPPSRAALDDAARRLAQRTWGERNTVRIQHPLSRMAPVLGRWLDMPRRMLPGDSNLPRVQSPMGGASQRLVVVPGREAEGIFHMPGGQCGHPLSPHYRDGHAAWEQGLPTPFLPGPALHRLQLVPAAGATPAP